MLYIRVSIIILATLSLLTSQVVSAPVGFISSTKLVDQLTVPDDEATDNNNSIEMLSNHKTNEVLGAKSAEKAIDSNMREICSLFKFSNFEKILCFNINNDELKNLLN